MASSSSPLQPDILNGMPPSIIQSSSFSFKPSSFSNPPASGRGFKLSSSVLSGSPARAMSKPNAESSSSKNFSKRMFDECDNMAEPQRKVFVNEDVVSQHLQDLHISQPRAKIARRSRTSDAIEASMVEDLESKFSHQASLNLEDLPPPRSRKLPGRGRVPQLRVSLHSELRNLRSPAPIVPEAIISKYRPMPRNGSTAVVLWRPPPNSIPDLICSAIKSGPGISSGYSSVPVTTRSRMRTYSEVTATPHSSNENLSTIGLLSAESRHNINRISEAPELAMSELEEDECEPIPRYNRRNSAPELESIDKQYHYEDEASMEL